MLDVLFNGERFRKGIFFFLRCALDYKHEFSLRCDGFIIINRAGKGRADDLFIYFSKLATKGDLSVSESGKKLAESFCQPVRCFIEDQRALFGFDFVNCLAPVAGGCRQKAFKSESAREKSGNGERRYGGAGSGYDGNGYSSFRAERSEERR